MGQGTHAEIFLLLLKVQISTVFSGAGEIIAGVRSGLYGPTMDFYKYSINHPPTKS